MSEPAEIRVTGELRYLTESNRWEASAYGGVGPDNPIEVRVEEETEEAVKAVFIAEWNVRDGTSWTDDQFAWTYNEGRD